MNTLDFLLEGLIYEAVLLYYRDPLKCLARNSNGVEGPTATYNENKNVNIQGSPRIRAAGWRTRDILYEQLGGLEAF